MHGAMSGAVLCLAHARQDGIQEASRNFELAHDLRAVAPIPRLPHGSVSLGAGIAVATLWHVPPPNSRRQAPGHGVGKLVDGFAGGSAVQCLQGAVAVAFQQDAAHIVAQGGGFVIKRRGGA